MRVTRLLFPLLVFLTSNTVIGASYTARIDAGTAHINAPAPNGYIEASDMELVLSFAKSLTPHKNVLLGIYISEEDAAKILGFQEANLDRYMSLQSDKRFKQDRLTKQFFRKEVESLKEKHNKLFAESRDKTNKLLDSVADEIGEKFEVPIEMDMGKPISLGISFENEDAIGVTILTRYEINIGDQIENYVIVAGVNLIYLKGKMIYAYVYSVFNSKGDIEWNRSTSENWANSILSVNRL
jgi:hypothetical protein